MKSKIGIIIEREFNERVRKKSFIITTLLTPLLMITLMLVPAFITTYSTSDVKHIAVVDDSKIVAGALENTDEVVFEAVPLPLEIARKEYSDRFAVLYIGNDIIDNGNSIQIYTNGSTSIGIERSIARQVESVLRQEKLKKHNIENLPQILMDMTYRVNIQSYKNTVESSADMADSGSVEDESSSSVAATVLAYVLSFLLYMFLLIYGVMVMQSVIEEKNSRVLEVMVTSVRPFEMMMGKILGVACVALLQIVIWVVLIAATVYFVLPMVLPEEISSALELMKAGGAAAVQGGSEIMLLQAIMKISNIGYMTTVLASLLVFMIGGFLLYAAMYAAVGSSVDSPQDAQQLQTPITIPIIVSIMVMLSVINDPTSELAFWFSMIPFTSPIVMMARIPYEIPAWEIIASAAILYASFMLVVWAAAKIYRVGILMHGKKPSYKDLWKWIRYK